MKISKTAYFMVTILSFYNVCDGTKQREKRYLFYNGDSKTILGFLVAIPFQIFLPGMLPETRSLKSYNDMVTLPKYEEEEEEEEEEMIIQSQYEEELTVLQSMFTYLQIEQIACQERLICLLSSEPEHFSPVSDMVLRELRKYNGPIIKVNSSLIWRYERAATLGMISTAQSCTDFYSKCFIDKRNFLNIAVLKVWQYIASAVNIQIM